MGGFASLLRQVLAPQELARHVSGFPHTLSGQKTTGTARVQEGMTRHRLAEHKLECCVEKDHVSEPTDIRVVFRVTGAQADGALRAGCTAYKVSVEQHDTENPKSSPKRNNSLGSGYFQAFFAGQGVLSMSGCMSCLRVMALVRLGG